MHKMTLQPSKNSIMHKNELFIVIKGNGITYMQITRLTCKFKLYQSNKNFNSSGIHVVDAR